jgi:dipeptidyl aminopeptidase/acylaminoacyl peptidase
MKSSRLSLLALVAVASTAGAQMPKKPLTQADWDRWRSITNPQISSDGKWAAYTLTPQVGDGEFVVRSTTGTTEIRIPVGYISRPNNTPGGLRGAGGAPGGGAGAAVGGRGQFSPDAKFAIVTVGAVKSVVDSVTRAQAATRAAGRGAAGRGNQAAGAGNQVAVGGSPVAGQPATSNPATRSQIAIISLADQSQTMIEGRAPRFAPESGKWMLYTPAGDTTVVSGGENAAGAGGGRGGRGGGGGGGGAAPASGGRRTYGSNLVLRNMATGAEEKMSDILAATFDDSAKVLVYTVASRDTTKDGIFIRDLNAGTTKTVLTGKGNYRGFTFDRTQQKFAFTSDRDEFGKEKARSAIYLGDLKTGTATAVITPAQWPTGYRLPDNGGSVSFTRASNALTFQLAPPPEDTIPADSLVGKSDFDLWHYKDPALQPTQKLRVNQDRNRTFQALLNIATKRITKLADDTITNVVLSDDAKVGLSTTGVKYAVESMWNPGNSDVYLIDPDKGTRKLLAEHMNGSASLSPGAKYVALFDDGQWSMYNIATGKTTNVTSAIKGVRFDQETHSTPDEPNAWGIAGWTKDDASVLIYDRFDIWQVDPTGVKPAVNVTDGVGRRENMTLRLIGLERDPEDRFVDTSKPVWLRAFDEDTKESGYYRDQVGVVRAPEKVIMGPYNYGQPSKAKNADMFMYTRSTAVEFPNLWVGPSLTSVQKISDANPWQKDYNWVTSELVTWTSNDGVQLQGILYKPENFDPSKKYPMVSYFYEDLSDGLYNYIAPNGRNVINPTHYASNGYLVFEPDIYYKTGHPGMSAYNSIVPGVQSLIAKGFVDPKALALQGQSWGGYQTAYIITKSNMFAAAMAGAPVANMTSAYGGIRWGSGVNRSMQYENGQSRIGKNLWEAQDLYIENSPLFHLPDVTTPLFIMSNDMDDAVPWYQGIEMFVGMRRLGKEVYMINYNNDVHNPASRANQKDVAMRMQQFFDNKLKGMPAPDWMVHGIPAKDKGKDQVAPPPGIIRP